MDEMLLDAAYKQSHPVIKGDLPPAFSMCPPLASVEAYMAWVSENKEKLRSQFEPGGGTGG
jgi:hypothetical protein